MDCASADDAMHTRPSSTTIPCCHPLPRCKPELAILCTLVLLHDGMLLDDAEPFELLIERCADLGARANDA